MHPNIENRLMGYLERMSRSLEEIVKSQKTALEAGFQILEAQNPPAETQQSEQPSSPDTETAGGTSDTYRTFWSKSYPANLGLIDWRPAARDISVWLSSLPILGNELGVEIGVTLTSKASTPLSGSPSPSTAAPTPEASGAVGRSPFSCGHDLEAVWQIGFDAGKRSAPASTSPAEDASREGKDWTQEAQAWLDSSSLEQPDGRKLWHLQGAVQRLIWAHGGPR